MKFDLSQIPFSRYGSYLAVSELAARWQGRSIPRGLYLKTVSGSASNPIVAKIALSTDDFSAELDGGSLSVFSENAVFGLCYPDHETLLIRGSAGSSLTLDFMTESGPYDYIYELDADGRHCYFANCYKNNTSFAIWAQEGEIALEQRWREQSSEFSRLKISGERGFLLVIKEVQSEWDRNCPEYDFDSCRLAVAEEFNAFRSGYPVIENYEELSILGAYLNWSAYVAPRGFLKRPAMLMSKNHMTSVWSWDHCFNALALSYKNPEAAWEQFMLMLDFQDDTGRLPDSVNDSKIIRNYVKPPIHGWALMKMLESGMKPNREQLKEAYAALGKQARWWLNYHDFDGDGLPEYAHGNDSGWDNSTVFAAVPPVCSPDLPAFLILQLDALSELAERLDMPEQSENWKTESEKLLKAFLTKCFPGDLPIAFRSGANEPIENKSLLPYLCLILGEKLPKESRKKMIASLKTGGFISEHGFATESLGSPSYRSDGYWRGPIWAPSTVILCDGLKKCGEEELARGAAEKFLQMCQTSGFAENFDVVTGAGLRDRAYTWTSSGAFILAFYRSNINRCNCGENMV